MSYKECNFISHINSSIIELIKKQLPKTNENINSLEP